VLASTDRIALYAAVTAAVVLLVWLSKIYWRRKLTRWAEGEGMKLVSYRGAWFYEGPSAFVRSRNQHLFRVVVQDRNGLHRSCWIMFGTFWGFTLGEPLTKVQWDNSADDE
jgi:hypothetical protein